MKTNIGLIISFVLYSSFCISQDMHFSQFYMSPLTLNPGMAGVNYNFEALINYKDQWRAIATPYKTLATSIDARLNKKKNKDSYWAGGLNFFSDKAGNANIGTTQANLTIAYHLNVAKYQTLGIGLQGGYVQKSIDYDSLQWASQYEPNIGYNPNIPSGEPTMSNFSYFDVGEGIVWAYDNSAGLIHVEDNHDLKANLGISVFHAYQKNSFYKTSKEKLYLKYVLHGTALISLPNYHNLAIIPGLVYFRQGPAQEIFVGLMIRYKLRQDSKYTGIKKGAAISLGGYYRVNDAIIASLLLEYSSYSIGISYDLNASKLTTASNGRGGLELSIKYTMSNIFKKTMVQNFKK